MIFTETLRNVRVHANEGLQTLHPSKKQCRDPKLTFPKSVFLNIYYCGYKAD